MKVFWCAAVVLCSSVVARPAIPPDARRVIEDVHRAAGARNFARLQRLLSADFMGSFAAGEQSAAEGMKRFREDPELLRELARATAKPCRFDGQVVECPRDAGPALRAGFEMRAGGWRMIYFVAGE